MDQRARLEAHAIIERLVADGDTFDSIEAARLTELVPRADGKRQPWAALGLRARLPGARTQGYAAGVGNASAEDESGRQVSWTSDGRPVWRVGAYKVMHTPGVLVIEDALERTEPQELAPSVQRGRCVLRYGAAGPEGLYLEHVRALSVLGVFQLGRSSLVLWKRPAASEPRPQH